jgi:hypothetical protein
MTKFQSATEEIAYYQDLWDRAQNQTGFTPQYEDQPEPEQEMPATQRVEQLHESSRRNLDLRDMLILSDDIDRVFHPERYTEAKDMEIIKATEKAARSPNPVQITSVGKDQEVVVTPDWTYGPVLSQIAELKIKLEALERQAHTANVNANERQEAGLNKEVASLRAKVEELCEKLVPHKISNAT